MKDQMKDPIRFMLIETGQIRPGKNAPAKETCLEFKDDRPRVESYRWAIARTDGAKYKYDWFDQESAKNEKGS